MRRGNIHSTNVLIKKYRSSPNNIQMLDTEEKISGNKNIFVAKKPNTYLNNILYVLSCGNKFDQEEIITEPEINCTRVVIAFVFLGLAIGEIVIACFIKSQMLFVDGMHHLINALSQTGINLTLSAFMMEKSRYSKASFYRRIEIFSKFVEGFCLMMFSSGFFFYTFFVFEKKLTFTSNWLAFLCVMISTIANILKLKFFTINDFVQSKEKGDNNIHTKNFYVSESQEKEQYDEEQNQLLYNQDNTNNRASSIQVYSDLQNTMNRGSYNYNTSFYNMKEKSNAYCNSFHESYKIKQFCQFGILILIFFAVSMDCLFFNYKTYIDQCGSIIFNVISIYIGAYTFYTGSFILMNDGTSYAKIDLLYENLTKIKDIVKIKELEVYAFSDKSFVTCIRISAKNTKTVCKEVKLKCEKLGLLNSFVEKEVVFKKGTTVRTKKWIQPEEFDSEKYFPSPISPDNDQN